MGLQARELYLEAKIRHTESAWNGAFSKKEERSETSLAFDFLEVALK